MSSNNPLVLDRSKINEAEFLWGAISSAEVRPCDSLGYRIIFQEKIWKPDSWFLCKLDLMVLQKIYSNIKDDEDWLGLSLL